MTHTTYPLPTTVDKKDSVGIWRLKTNQIGACIGDKDDLNTSAKDDLVSAINEVLDLADPRRMLVRAIASN